MKSFANVNGSIIGDIVNFQAEDIDDSLHLFTSFFIYTPSYADFSPSVIKT
ncbi:hypothetical protein RCG23_21535 [Neobacillus sp. PS3-34]|uniref:hypothetical protein n=1 Tax=Neobacillus sp. PS3-34 TaxID=3070678 RepID=UPI0027E07BE9|nr:hypothetical protein [Neobacillus sp. PS3-34]WML50735.1 hypothetical protein RCG23_21535 [Neobacillus sp. PS3-34]